MNNYAGRAIIIFGDNSYERSLELAKITQQAEREDYLIEKINSEILNLNDIPSLFSGLSILSEKRVLIIKNLSENKEIWLRLPDLLLQLSSEVILVDIEDKLDKRTKLFKNIAAITDIREFKSLTIKDEGVLAERSRSLAEKQGLDLSLKDAKFLVSWVGVNEWKVKSAIDRLALIGAVNRQAIEEYIPQTIEQNVFGIFESAMNGRSIDIVKSIKKLSISDSTDEAYQFFGLITSQSFNLWALKTGLWLGKTTPTIAKNIGANAWAMSKMEPLARKCSQDDLRYIARSFNETDESLKSSFGSAWDLIESLLSKISARMSNY